VVSVNQMLPSGPTVTARTSPGRPPNSVMTPAGVMRPILPGDCGSLLDSPNQRLPSGPAVIRLGVVIEPRENTVTTPAGVIRPIAPMSLPPGPFSSVNQRLPSGPAVIP